MTVISFCSLISLTAAVEYRCTLSIQEAACLPSPRSWDGGVTRIYLVGSDLHSVPIDPWQNIHEEFGVIGNIALLEFGILVMEGEAERR